LGRREVGSNFLSEDYDMTLNHLAKNEANLSVEQILFLGCIGLRFGGLAHLLAFLAFQCARGF